MHPKLREIIDTKPSCRATIQEGSQYLPEDEEELDGWLLEASEDLDALAFDYLVIGAIDRGLPIRSRHLEKGLKFLPSYEAAYFMIFHVTGDDIPERVARALQLGAINPTLHAGVLVATWYWCEEHGVPFPQEMRNEARATIHRYRGVEESKGMFAHFAMITNDQKMQDLLLGADLSEARRKELKRLVDIVDKGFREKFGKGVLDTVSDKPAQAKRPKTLRRAVEHIGRNDPCPCGSGKKHKRCCFEKTRERLLHSSDVEGMTVEELNADLEAHMNVRRLTSLDTSATVRLDPLKLDPALIPLLITRLTSWRLFEEATAVLEKVGLNDELVCKWDTLTILAAEMGRKNVVRRLVALHPNPENRQEKDYVHVSARLLLADGDAEKTLAVLEETSRDLVDSSENGTLYFFSMGFVLSPLGALGITLAQAAIARMEIKEALDLLNMVATKRAALDLPLEDPMMAIIDRRIAAEAGKEENKDSVKLAAAMRKMDALAEKERKAALASREMEKELAKLTKEAAKVKGAAPSSTIPDDREIKALREKLRIHEANEKANAEERAAHRRATSELLLAEESLREKEANLRKAAPRKEESDEENQLIKGGLEGTQPLRLINYPEKFLKSLAPFPRHVGRQTMALLGRIASGEPAAFHDVLRLKACHDVFRARVGIDHRLLFRLHAEELEVIALIDRRDLDARIKTLRKHD